MGVVINKTSVVVVVEQAREMYSSQDLRYDYGMLFCKFEDSADVFLWLNKIEVITTDAAGAVARMLLVLWSFWSATIIYGRK
jgi:hypothetical protein